VTLGQTVNLVLEVSNLGTKLRPDLSVLEGVFEIVGRPRVETQIYTLNGKTTSLVRYVATLAPLEIGIMRIPSLTLGPFKTEPIELDVRAPASGADGVPVPEVFVEATAEPGNPYLQSEVRYQVRLFHLADLLGGSLSEPSMADALALKVGDDVTSKETRHGRQYQVIERSYAIFPQASGTLTIPAPVFNGEVAQPADENGALSQNGGTGIDPFGGFFQASRKVFARGPELTLEVRPVPQSFSGHHWVAAESVTLSESWSARPLQFRVGEPATRTINLAAVGLTAAQLPALELGDSPTLKMYPDQPAAKTVSSGDNVVATVELKVAVVPTSPGVFALPEITLHWWDTRADQARTAKIPSREITVLAVPQPEPVNSGVQTPSAGNIEPSTPGNETGNTNQWPATAVVLLFAWLVTLTLWLRERRRRPRSQDDEVKSSSVRQCRAALSDACKSNDAGAAKRALLLWGQAIWSDDPPFSLVALAAKLDSETASAAVSSLDEHLYGRADAWDGVNSWKPLKTAMQVRPRRDAGAVKKANLPALYPG